MTSHTRNYGGGILRLVWMLLVVVACAECEKYQYASADMCGRYSAYALYHEKFQPITNNIIEDSNEFVRRVSESIADSMRTIMMKLPDRDYSEKEEKAPFLQFETMQKSFSKKMKMIAQNVTKNWDDLLSSHHELMMDSGQSSLGQYLGKVRNMADAYQGARKQLDRSTSTFVRLVKATLQNGLQGISMAAQDALTRNATNATEEEKAQSPEERMQAKKLEIAEMIGEGFLGKVTVDVIRKKVDVFKRVDTKPENRDSALDDTLFDILMIRNKMAAIIQPDLPDDKGVVDLTRRTIYTHWAGLSERMYAVKIAARKSSEKQPPQINYKKFWADDEQLDLLGKYLAKTGDSLEILETTDDSCWDGETLMDLMELYP